MKIKYLKVKNWLLLSLASLLGINTGCTKEYGCPEDEYHNVDTTVNVSFEGARFSGGDGNWFEGTATKEITVTLNKQSE